MGQQMSAESEAMLGQQARSKMGQQTAAEPETMTAESEAMLGQQARSEMGQQRPVTQQ